MTTQTVAKVVLSVSTAAVLFFMGAFVGSISGGKEEWNKEQPTYGLDWEPAVEMLEDGETPRELAKSAMFRIQREAERAQRALESWQDGPLAVQSRQAQAKIAQAFEKE